MGGIVKLNKIGKVRASTLVETIVAMLIITIVFSMAFLIFLNISKNSNNAIKTKAYFLASDILVKTISEKQYFDSDYNFGNVIIKRIVTEYHKNDELFQLNITAFDFKNHKLFEQNKLIIIEKD